VRKKVEDLTTGNVIRCPRDDATPEVVTGIGIPPSDRQRRVVQLRDHTHIMERYAEVEVAL